MNVNMIGRGRIFFSGIFFLSSLCSASAQSVSLSIDEMFRLADQNSKSIRMHELAISEAEQGVKVAKDGRLPSIGFGLELQYIGDGWLSDRDFSNGVHADMPHFGNSYVIKAAQVVYAGGSVSRNIESSRLSQQMTEQEYANNRQNVRFLLLGHYLDLFQLNNQKVVYEKISSRHACWSKICRPLIVREPLSKVILPVMNFNFRIWSLLLPLLRIR